MSLILNPPFWAVLLQVLGSGFLTPILVVALGAYFMRHNRAADTDLKQTETQDTYFKQAVELASQYREELGRQKAIIEALEEKLEQRESECDRKIALLQDQINGLIGQLSVKSRKAFEGTQPVADV